jgi:hypothetical protein
MVSHRMCQSMLAFKKKTPLFMGEMKELPSLTVSIIKNSKQ